MENKTLELGGVVDIFSNMPSGQLVFLGLFLATWIIGGNILLAYHFNRIGKRWNPFSWPFDNFNSLERAIFRGLIVLSVIFGIAALIYSNG